MVLAAFAVITATEVRAQFTFAEDVASNYNGGGGEPTFGTGGNGGYGFDAWSFSAGGSAGGFVGNPADGGIGGMSTESFGLFANPTNSGNFIDANRDLSTAMQVGDTFSFQWGVNWDSGGPGSKGFNLYSGGVEIINVNIGSTQDITVNGTNTGFGFGTNVMTWNFFYSSPTTLVVTANDRDGAGTYSNSFTVSAGIDAFRWYAAQLAAGDNRQPYYNNLLITNSGLYNVATAQTESRYLTGSGSLAKTGNGTLTISGTTNNFTGTVGITNGAIRATASSALGSASAVTVQSGAALEYSGGITVNRNLTINSTGVSGAGALRNISGNNLHSGNLTLGSASRIASDAGTLTISGAVSGSNVGLTVGGAGNTVIQTAVGIGSGRLTKENAGTLTLTANNSFTGNTLISGGALSLGSGGTTGAVTGTITNNGALIYNRSDNITQSGVISGTGSVTKQAAGTLTLSSANTYSGATTISAGTVVADNSASLGTSAGATTVENGATLEVSGGITLADNITITGSGVGGGGAIRSLGDGENTLSGTITLGGNARINVDAPIGSVTSLVNWGTTDLTVEPGSTTLGYYTQTSTTMTMNGTTGFGDTLGGYLPVSDWSGVSNFGLLLSITGANNNLPFSLAFYDEGFNIANTYTGTTFGIGSSLAVAPLTLSTAGSGLMSGISGLQFTWDGGGAINTTFDSIVSIPTSGLIISGNVGTGSNVLSVGSTTGGEGTAADGVRFTGIISGSGGSYGGTSTTLVKDGAGIVYLSGNNTFSGDTRIEAGILAISFGASTNALGVGSDLFISSGASLQVAGNVSVSSIQGTGEGNTGDVLLSGGSALTINGAGKSMTMAGDISGFGGFRVAGNTNTVVTLTGDNTYSQATTITAGTLAVAGTGGDQALRSTTSITIGSSGKLLLSTSDQVRDVNSTVTLSGGTIQRASGVSEVFGNLNLTAASFLDFGTGDTGTIRFGTYTPSSLLTVQNFLPGNKLQFGSTLTEAQLNNGSLFSFSSGFTTGTEGGFFTITAIPEPSTYVAAAGLALMLLWSFRRKRRAPAVAQT